MANPRLSVAEYLDKAIELSGKTQREIAQEVGYNRPNVLSMMKQGQTKVPIEKVPQLAKACGVDPVFFIRLAMIEYYPEIWKVISQHFGDIVTDEEQRLLELYREAKAEGRAPDIDRTLFEAC